MKRREGIKMKCQNCSREGAYKRQKTQDWLCPQCGVIIPDGNIKKEEKNEPKIEG